MKLPLFKFHLKISSETLTQRWLAWLAWLHRCTALSGVGNYGDTCGAAPLATLRGPSFSGRTVEGPLLHRTSHNRGAAIIQYLPENFHNGNNHGRLEL